MKKIDFEVEFLNRYFFSKTFEELAPIFFSMSELYFQKLSKARGRSVFEVNLFNTTSNMGIYMHFFPSFVSFLSSFSASADMIKFGKNGNNSKKKLLKKINTKIL